MADDKFVDVGKISKPPSLFTEEEGRAAVEKVFERCNVVELDTVTTLDIDPNRILNKALDNLDYVVVLGWDKGGEFYFASSKSDGGECLWLMELAKKNLLEIIE